MGEMSVWGHLHRFGIGAYRSPPPDGSPDRAGRPGATGPGSRDGYELMSYTTFTSKVSSCEPASIGIETAPSESAALPA